VVAMQIESLTMKGTEVLANTEKLATTTVNGRTITVFVDISIDQPDIENVSALLAGTILKNLTTAENSTDIIDAIKSAVKDLAQTLPSMVQGVSEILPISIAALIEKEQEIKIAATGKVDVYKVSQGRMYPVYLILDREPIELTPDGEILTFDLALDSVEKGNIFSIVILSDGMKEYISSPKIINLLSKVASPKAVIRKLRHFLEQNPPRSNATIAIMWEPKNLEGGEAIADLTSTTMTAAAAKEEIIEKLKKTYTRETLKKLTQTLRDIRKEVAPPSKTLTDKTQRQTPPKLIAKKRQRRTTEISVATAIILILVILCIIICGYYACSSWRGRVTPASKIPATHQTASPSNQSTASETATQTGQSAQTATLGNTPGQSTPTQTNSATSTQQTQQETSQEKPVSGISSSTTSSTSTTEEASIVPIHLDVKTLPSGLRTSIVVNGKVVASAKSPNKLSAQISPQDLDNAYVVAMFMGSICASEKLENPTGKVLLDCRYLAEDNPQKPIVILTRPSNIRIKIFRRSDGKLLLSSLAPTRIPVLGPDDEEIVIRAYINGRQCSAVVTTWKKALEKKYLTLICAK